jgi:hypothetical protein
MVGGTDVQRNQLAGAVSTTLGQSHPSDSEVYGAGIFRLTDGSVPAGAARGRLNRHAVAFGLGTLRLVYRSGRRPRRVHGKRVPLRSP